MNLITGPYLLLCSKYRLVFRPFVTDIMFLNHQMYPSESQLMDDMFNAVVHLITIVAALEMQAGVETAPSDNRILRFLKQIFDYVFRGYYIRSIMI